MRKSSGNIFEGWWFFCYVFTYCWLLSWRTKLKLTPCTKLADTKWKTSKIALKTDLQSWTNFQLAFLQLMYLSRWIRSWPPATCRFSTRRSFDHHGKRNSNNNIKRVWKIKKIETCSYISHWSESDENGIVCEIACDCVKRANVVIGLRKEIFAKTCTDTHKPTSAQRITVTTTTHIHLIIVCGVARPTALRGN